MNTLINYDLVRKWLLTGFFWLVFAPFVGILVSLMFTYPDLLGTSPYLSFGRLRPVHVSGVIYGAFSTMFLSFIYYVLPRLTGVRVYKEHWGYYLLYLWNITLALGFLSLLAGYNQGLEVAEFPLPIDILVFIVLCAFTLQILMTVKERAEKRMYVSLWYLIAAFVWTDMSWALGNFILPYAVPGVNNAAFHGLFIHYTVGLWITPAGYVLIYYFLPPAARNPLYSHKLSLIGFWSLALFYPLVGTHHYLFSPIQEWVETIAIVASMLLIIPVWTVVQNFIGTLIGRWYRLREDYTVRFLILGTIFYLFGCLQGSLEALRTVQVPTHFTDFVIGHSHLTIAGTFVLWTIGSAYYVMPKILRHYESGGFVGSESGSSSSRPSDAHLKDPGNAQVEIATEETPLNNRLASYSFWMITIALTLMVTSLSVQGYIQGNLLMDGTDFVDSLLVMEPFWLFRTITGTLFDLGIFLSVVNFLRLDTRIVAAINNRRIPSSDQLPDPSGSSRGKTAGNNGVAG